jgi:hypothetical protein
LHDHLDGPIAFFAGSVRESAGDLGHERDAALSLGGLLRDSDLHERGEATG